MTSMGRKPVCLHNDAVCLPHIKDKSLWASNSRISGFPNGWLKIHYEFLPPETGGKKDLSMNTGDSKNF